MKDGVRVQTAKISIKTGKHMLKFVINFTSTQGRNMKELVLNGKQFLHLKNIEEGKKLL
jgi:hypothetical protein